MIVNCQRMVENFHKITVFFQNNDRKILLFMIHIFKYFSFLNWLLIPLILKKESLSRLFILLKLLKVEKQLLLQLLNKLKYLIIKLLLINKTIRNYQFNMKLESELFRLKVFFLIPLSFLIPFSMKGYQNYIRLDK